MHRTPVTTSSTPMMEATPRVGRVETLSFPLLSSQLEATTKTLEECLETPLDVDPEPELNYYRNAKGTCIRIADNFP